tara:strand:+ start:214 stop:741 length:528 start_codon:yes stop_codon:yes gene_type:complete
VEFRTVISRVSKGYWIWGQFDIESTKQIDTLYQSINSKFDGPKFDVHLTISGPIHYQDELHNPIFESLSSKFSKFNIQLNGLGYKNEFFQSLFLNAAKDQSLKNLKLEVDKCLKLDVGEYFPHISLFYGMVASDSKIKTISELKSPKHVLLDKISIVEVDEEIKSWRVLKSFSLV